MKTYLTFIFIIVSYKVVDAQFFKMGFRIEPALLLSESNNITDYGFSPYSIYLTTIINPVENMSIEIRPGYFIAGEYYGGFEIGCFLRWSIFSSKYFLIGGINNHSNTWLGSHNGGSGISKSILYNGMGIGYQKDSKLSFDLMYYWTDDKEYAYSRDTDWLTYSRTIYKKMKGIIKLGFNLSFTIL